MENLAELKKLAHEIKKIAEKVIALEEPTVEEGQYWEIESSVFPYKQGEVIRIESVNAEHQTARFQAINRGHTGNGKIGQLIKLGRKLSDSEVQQALIEEAERRGFNEVGLEYKDADDGQKETIGHHYSSSVRFQYVSSNFHSDGLTDGCGGWVYYEGTWAEIIADEWEVGQIGGNAIVVNESCATSLTSARMIKDTAHGLTKEEAETIAKALNR